MPRHHQPHKEPVPEADAAADEAEVQLCIMVAPRVRAQIHSVARARGLTLRTLVLSALRDADALKDAPDVELADRRATTAAAKARLWREYKAARKCQADSST